MTATARFRLRVISLLEEKGWTQKSLKGDSSEGWISNVITGRRNLKLDDAEKIAARLQRPLAELLRRPDDHVYELDNLEARLVEAFRAMNETEQQAFITIATLRQRQPPNVLGGKVAVGRGLPISKGAAHGGASSTRVAADPARVSHILAKAVEDILKGATGGQAPASHAGGARGADDRRRIRRSTSKPA